MFSYLPGLCQQKNHLVNKAPAIALLVGSVNYGWNTADTYGNVLSRHFVSESLFKLCDDFFFKIALIYPPLSQKREILL